jgi:hypothetical protein
LTKFPSRNAAAAYQFEVLLNTRKVTIASVADELVR